MAPLKSWGSWVVGKTYTATNTYDENIEMKPGTVTYTVSVPDGYTINSEGLVPCKVSDDTEEIDLFSDTVEIEAAEERAWSKLEQQRIDAGQCVKCGKTREMTVWGLKECERCWR